MALSKKTTAMINESKRSSHLYIATFLSLGRCCAGRGSYYISDISVNHFFVFHLAGNGTVGPAYGLSQRFTANTHQIAMPTIGSCGSKKALKMRDTRSRHRILLDKPREIRPYYPHREACREPTQRSRLLILSGVPRRHSCDGCMRARSRSLGA